MIHPIIVSKFGRTKKGQNNAIGWSVYETVMPWISVKTAHEMIK